MQTRFFFGRLESGYAREILLKEVAKWHTEHAAWHRDEYFRFKSGI